MTETKKTRLQEENELAESLGFKCEPDRRRGGGFCRFIRGEWHVWDSTGYSPTKGKILYWQVARLHGGQYIEHASFKNVFHEELRDALEYAIEEEGKLE